MSQKVTRAKELAQSEREPVKSTTLHLLSGVRYEFISDRVAEGKINGKLGRNGHRGAGTAQWYEDVLGLLCRWLQEHESVGHVEQVTRASLIHYIGELRERGRAAAYVQSHIRAMRTWLRWARRHYDLHASLFDEDRRFTIAAGKPITREPEMYTEQQVDQIFEAIRQKTARGTRERDAMLIATYLGTGCRLSEIAALTPEDVEQDDEGSSFLHVLGKGKKWRWVPVSPKLRRDLERYIHRHRPQSANPQVFLTVTGKPLVTRTVQAIFERVERDLGFELFAHALRHNYATHFVARENPNVEQLRRIMGHEDISTTMRYMHLRRRDLAQGVEEFSPR